MDEKYLRIPISRWAMDEQKHGCYIRLEDEEPQDHPDAQHIGYFLSMSKRIKPVALRIVKDHNAMLENKD